MNRRTITVESEPHREGQKTRSFSVELLAYVLANDLWELGSGARDRLHRPVLMAYAGTAQGSRAFSANLRAGRPALKAMAPGLRFPVPLDSDTKPSSARAQLSRWPTFPRSSAFNRRPQIA